MFYQYYSHSCVNNGTTDSYCTTNYNVAQIKQTCTTGQNCSNAVCVNNTCISQCSGKNCGSNGCKGFCGILNGNCPSGQTCNSNGVCIAINVKSLSTLVYMILKQAHFIEKYKYQGLQISHLIMGLETLEISYCRWLDGDGKTTIGLYDPKTQHFI